jgi:hypothetical protein
MLKNDSGEYAETPDAILELLAETHFKNGPPLQQGNYISEENVDTILFGKFINKDRVIEAIQKFCPYKRPGMDEIHPILLQNAPDTLYDKLLNIFQASLKYSYIPTNWNISKIVFLAKTNKKDYELPKSFRPLSLTSFVLKTNERLLDNYIKEETLTTYPLKSPQHAFRTGLSTESAMHNLIIEAENAIYGGKFCLAVLLDIEGAFDNATYQSIINALKKFKVNETIIGWIHNLLKNRKGTMTFKDASLTKTLTRGVPQGGILSPTLWNMVIDELLILIGQTPITRNGYADDIVISYTGTNPDSIVLMINSVRYL